MAEYKVAEISYEGTKRKIVCPGQNGPCALPAVVNYLILRFHVKIEPTWEETIPEEKLQETILECLDMVFPKKSQDKIKEELSGVLPDLSKQSDLNPYVNSIDGFDMTPVLAVIRALGIPIFHGCILNDKDSNIAIKLQGSSYSNLVALDMLPVVEPESDTDKEIRDLIKDFLHTKTKRQITSYGISCIRDHMILSKQNVAILYRDGVLEVMCLHNGTIHLLQSKTLGNELTEEEETWRILYDVHVEDLFVTSDFQAVIPENWDRIQGLYMNGKNHCTQLPEQKAKEEIAESERHAAELLEMVEREKREKEKKRRKQAAGSKKTKNPQGDDTQSSEIAAEQMPVAPIPPPKSLAFQKFKEFLEKFDCCGKSKISYFEGEVDLMKRRNLFEISIDYSHILDYCDELALLIRDNFDSVRQDLQDSLVEYLVSKGIEKEKAEHASFKVLDKPKGYQSFTEFAERNRNALTEYHQLYDMVVTRCTSELGRRMGRGFLKYMFDKYKTGYCWEGNFKASDMRVSRCGRKFIITAGAYCGLSKEGIEADLKMFC